ncbi:hypothetical protein FACS189450_06680 [Spirochaetia bacterium]|nr:hypothetical protein FACS189450_06680 [Spirochaetia bacterium]
MIKGTKGLFRLGAIALALSLMVLTGCPTDGGDPNRTTPALAGTITIQQNGIDVTAASAGDTLTAVYSGTETGIGYQWSKDGAAISGATGNTHIPADTGSYTVTVSATGYQCKTSAAVTIGGAALAPLTGTITIQKNDNDVTAASTGDTLTAVYSGTETGIGYQWSKDGAAISGATDNTHIPADAGRYTVTVSATGYHSKTSAAVTVLILVGGTKEIAIPLTVNTWADGSLSYGGQQWFSFTATANRQYIHAKFNGTANGVYVQLYDSDDTPIGSRVGLSSSTGNSYWLVSAGAVYYMKVTSSGSGTYQIGFTDLSSPPSRIVLPAEGVTTLTENVWTSGSLSSGGQQWFRFTATATTQYIHADFTGTLPGDTEVGYVFAQLYDSAGTAVIGSIGLDGVTPSVPLTVTSGQVYYIRVSSGASGTYRIGFGGMLPPGTVPTALTENTWANGNLPLSGQQWFTFTATTSVQYIHANFNGTLSSVYVQLFDSNGATFGGSTSFSSSYGNTPNWTITSGQVYYIRATSGSSGTYQIGFTNSSARPPILLPAVPTTLTVGGDWTDGSLSTDGEQWFTFSATHWLPIIISTNFNGTLSSSNGVSVQIYAGDSTAVGSSTKNGTTQRVTAGNVYYVKVTPFSSIGGTYQIKVSRITVPSLPMNQLVSLSQGERWFFFVATASTLGIQATFNGQRQVVSVQLYDSSGTAVGSSTTMSSTNYSNVYYTETSSISLSVTRWEQYYIRVTTTGLFSKISFY